MLEELRDKLSRRKKKTPQGIILPANPMKMLNEKMGVTLNLTINLPREKEESRIDKLARRLDEPIYTKGIDHIGGSV